MPHPPATRNHRDHARTERGSTTRLAAALLVLTLLLAACGGTPPPGGGGPGGGGPGDDDPPALASSARIVLEPAGFILPGAGATQRLTAIVYDDTGQPTNADVTWEIDDAAAASVAADGTVTALAEVGSVQVVARAGTLASAPALGVIAPLVPGAVTVSDAQVVALEEVDAAADFGLGWRYGAVLTGLAPLAPGDLIVGTGMTPLGGRVVDVATTVGGQRVTLELVDLDELFTDLRIETELAIDPADLLVDPELLDDYDVQRLADGTLRFVPRAGVGTSALRMALAPAADDGEFQLGPFTCTTDDVALPGLSLASPPKIEVTPKIDFVLEYDRSKGGLQRIGLKGSLLAKISYEPRFGAFFEATLKCTRELATWTLPVGGPLAFVFGAQMPVGVGFDLQAKLAVAQFGLKAEAAATVALGAYLDCRGPTGCEPDFEASFEPTLAFEPIWPSVDEQFRLEMMLYPFSFADVQLGSSLLKSLPWLKDALKIKLLRGRFGVEQTLNLATITAQASNPTYGSTIATRLRSDLRIGEEIPLLEKFEKLLKISIKPIVFTLPRVDLWLSPTGTITVDPDVVRPRGTGDDVGELATFTVTIQETSTFGLVGVEVERIELRWRKRDEANRLVFPPGPGACFLLGRSGGATTFSCETDFTEDDTGPQRIYAFAQVRLFGIPVPVPLELGLNANATVTVRDGTPPPRVLAAGQFHSLYATPAGSVQSWGWNEWVQLGIGGGLEVRSVPGPVPTLTSPVASVAAGRFTSFAVLESGNVHVWGTSTVSALGDSLTYYDPPFCFWDSDSEDSEDPGDDKFHCQPTPARAPDLRGVDRVVIGASGSNGLALHRDGTVSSWGSTLTSGTLLGRPFVRAECDFAGCPTPGKIVALDNVVVVDVAMSPTHGLALGARGGVFSWGTNASLELGAGSLTTSRITPALVGGFPEATFIVAVAAGGDGENVLADERSFSVALDDQGRVWTWGANDVGQLGAGAGPARATPAMVGGISDVVEIAAGSDHVLALTRDGVLYGWGGNGDGQVGNDANASVIAAPTPVLADVNAFDAGSRHSLARTRDGALWGWGFNQYGQVGDGSTVTRRGPEQIAPPTAP